MTSAGGAIPPQSGAVRLVVRLGFVRPPLVRLAVAALVVGLSIVVWASSARGATRAAGTYLAPAAACRGADDARASAAVQRKAVVCLVNWARRRAHLRPLAPRSKLRRAATLKGRRVASCKQFSHTPCGSPSTSAVRATGYRFSWFGENLYAGPWGGSTPRAVVAAWLASPGHRANILRRSFRHIGAALVRAPGLLDAGASAVWVTEFTRPR